MFFGTQGGIVMQADRTGTDDGALYVATLVCGWEVFQSPGQTITFRQARASFAAAAGQPFQPQLSACVDYVVVIPTPPAAGPDPILPDIWDEGHWGPDMGGPPPPVPTAAERPPTRSGTSRTAAGQCRVTPAGCRSASPAFRTRLSSR
jgi:hypothetical protein